MALLTFRAAVALAGAVGSICLGAAIYNLRTVAPALRGRHAFCRGRQGEVPLPRLLTLRGYK